MLAPELRIADQLPEGWLPPDLVVLAFAERGSNGRWEAVLPDFTVVGVGESLAEAVDEAFEMLADYLGLCAAEGLSFDQSLRRIPTQWMMEIAGKSLLGSVRRRIARPRHRGPDGSYRGRLPIHPAHC